MKPVSVIPLSLLLCIVSSAASGQADGQVRIAVANSGRILNEMQESKAFREDIETERANLEKMANERRDGLKQLAQQRNNVRNDTPQWEGLNEKFTEAAGEFQLWTQQEQIKLQRKQKRKVRELFSKIEKAIGEVAQRDGYELVVADVRPELQQNLDQVTPEALGALMSSRNVLYASPKMDISDAVIALLDSKYKRGGGTTAAPPAANPAQRKTPAPRPAAPEKP
jgi:Skp family chaperone for outer membrane proteins